MICQTDKDLTQIRPSKSLNPYWRFFYSDYSHLFRESLLFPTTPKLFDISDNRLVTSTYDLVLESTCTLSLNDMVEYPEYDTRTVHDTPFRRRKERLNYRSALIKKVTLDDRVPGFPSDSLDITTNQWEFPLGNNISKMSWPFRVVNTSSFSAVIFDNLIQIIFITSNRTHNSLGNYRITGAHPQLNMDY